MSEQPQRSDIPHYRIGLTLWLLSPAIIGKVIHRGRFMPRRSGRRKKRCLMRLNIYAVMPDCIANFLMAMTGKCRPGGYRFVVLASKMARLALLKASIYTNSVGIRFVEEHYYSHCPLDSLLDEIEFTVAFRPASPEKDIRTESYLTRFPAGLVYVRSF